MIKINLIPNDVAGQGPGGQGFGPSSANAGGAAVGLTLLAVLVILGGLSAYIYAEVSSASRAKEDLKNQAAELKKQLDETRIAYDKVNADIATTQRMIQIAERLDPEDRVLWSRSINALPLLVPEGVFLTNIQVTRQVSDVETEESIKRRQEFQRTRRGNPPVVERVPMIQQTMVLNGVVYIAGGSDTQRLNQVVEFANNLRFKRVKLPFDREESSFLTGFNPQPETSAVATSQVEGREVSTFTLTMRTRQMVIN